MNGIEQIQKTFYSKKTLKLMTHVVGGYPDKDLCMSMIMMMAENGVDFIEVQLPFSDPIADGPVIVQANHQALQAGIQTETVFSILRTVRKKVTIPIFIMSYLNPIIAFGLDRFIHEIKESELNGVIVPDCPVECCDIGLLDACRRNAIAFVPLIAPSTKKERMMTITKQCNSPFVYAVLRYGVTGRKTQLDEPTKTYLSTIRQITNKYVAAGFGIREKAQLDALVGFADCGIVGSALLQIINDAKIKGNDPLDAATQFVESLVRE